jgi:phosphoserine phosphatase RsbU/P
VAEMVSERLRNLLSVTDSALGRLAVEDLLGELLDRIRMILDADTAAVLLVDRNSGHLVATAARGLEEEVRQGVRVPVGTGFAGKIAEQRRPVMLDRVDATTVANPILWEKGVRTMLGVPLLGNEDVIGVLHVGRMDERPFTGDDAELLEVAAERVAGATQARQLAVEAAAGMLLERSLMPGKLPRCDGVELAARYVPAENRLIGGDWYDAFTLPSGQLWVVTGDVAGHGLGAAVIMGRVRSALRAYALQGGGPAEVLELVDRKVHHFEFGSMVTVVCGRATPPYDDFDICVAGHPPPVCAVPGQEAALVKLDVGPPLGILAGITRTTTTIRLPAGGVLLFYTDGLVERREESLDVSLRRLETVTVADAPETVCRTVMHELIGGRIATDDIAMLAIRRSATSA